MGKYDPLGERLAREDGGRWETSFGEIEAVIGASLPKGAREREGWWLSEPEAVHAKSWGERDWSVASVDLAAERVTFKRNGAAGGGPEVEDTASETESAPGQAVAVPPRRGLGLNPAWIGGVVVGAAGLAGTLAALWLKRRR